MVRTQFSVDARILQTCLSKLHNLCYFMIAHYIYEKTLWPFFMDGVQLPQESRATMRRPFTFYHQVPRNFWCSFDQLRKDERLS